MAEKEASGGSGPSSQQPAAPRSYFPAFDLAASITVAEAMHNRGGGRTDRAHLATFLNYKSTRSGAFNMRLAAARLFGVIEGRGDDLSVSSLGERIVAPTYSEEAKAARVEAFLNIPMFQKTYHDFDGKQLPPPGGMQNYLQNEHGIPSGQTKRVLRILMDSAEQAHFFEARGGRSHMIKPLIRDAGDPGVDEQKDQENTELPPAVGLNSDCVGPSTAPTTLEEVRLEYVRKLISQIGSADHEQGELMDRIERLLSSKDQA